MTVVVLAVLAVFLIAVVAIFNRLVGLRNRTQTAWADVETQLKRRADLVPNLVETARGYASHERKTLEAATAARTRAQSESRPGPRAGAESQLGGAIRQVMAVSERYPDLKASANFADLQSKLSETEDRIAIARHVYNDTVQTYENAREQFPMNIVARLFAFKEREFFELEESSEREPAQVRT